MQTRSSPDRQHRFRLVKPGDEAVELAGSSAASNFASDVRAGLAAHPKRLPCRHFYDAEGSRLFEQICRLPEYYVTRAERAILSQHASTIVAGLPPEAQLWELGSGNGDKTRLLIEALVRKQVSLRYVPIDVSQSALEQTAALLESFPTLSIRALQAEYDAALALAVQTLTGPRLIAWLGSSIGNLDRDQAAAFLGTLRARSATRDALLVGFDLRKDRRVLEAAYNDASGVTARFNLNLLARINRELGGRFDLGSFEHRARYDVDAGRVALHLISKRKQRVPIDKLSLRVEFDTGEAIHTEDSYKYSIDEIARLAERASFAVKACFQDADGLFCSALLTPPYC
ncbi:MAG: L-histidine N(alpha)-methyltransferase [Proteobacteria bacterium]|nr:L-histidine N(alpha)-methyltransferase [Pseudomonadota bacterium]